MVQTCVVSLEEFEAAIAEDFAVHFVPEGEESDDLDPEAEEDEIPYAGDTHRSGRGDGRAACAGARSVSAPAGGQAAGDRGGYVAACLRRSRRIAAKALTLAVAGARCPLRPAPVVC